jgi:hypothetical protein
MSENRALAAVWTTRPETAADAAAIREVNLAAFPSKEEVDPVDAPRASDARTDGLSIVLRPTRLAPGASSTDPGTSDVLGTGHHAAVVAKVGPGKRAAVWATAPSAYAP